MATIRVAGVQMVVTDDLETNLSTIVDHIMRCEGDFIVFPELALTGPNHSDFSVKRVETAWAKIATACRQSYTTAVVGTGAKSDGEVLIQSRVFSDAGLLIGAQDKLIPTKEERSHYAPGAELNTFNHMGFEFGCLVGNDLWVSPGQGPYVDPRLAYQLGHRGAQVVFHSADAATDPRFAQYYEANLLLRAWESQLYVVTVKAASENDALNSHSGVISPEGEWLVQAPLVGPSTFAFDLELDTEQ